MQNNKSIGENNTCLNSIRTCCNDNDWPFLCPKCLVTSATVLETICNQVVHLCFVGESNVKIQASQQKILENWLQLDLFHHPWFSGVLRWKASLNLCCDVHMEWHVWISGSPDLHISSRHSQQNHQNPCPRSIQGTPSQLVRIQSNGPAAPRKPKDCRAWATPPEPLVSRLQSASNLDYNLHPDTIRAKHGKIMEKSRSIRWLTISFSCLRCVPWYSRSRDSQIWLCREILGAVVSQAPNSSSKLWHGTVFYRLCWLAVSNLDPDSDAKYAPNKQNICPGLSIIEHNIPVFPASKI